MASDDPAFIRIFYIKRIENTGIFKSLFRKFIHSGVYVLKDFGIAAAAIYQLAASAPICYVVPKALPFLIDFINGFFGSAKLFTDIKVLLEHFCYSRIWSDVTVVHIIAVLKPQKPKPSAVVIRELLCHLVVGFFAS